MSKELIIAVKRELGLVGADDVTDEVIGLYIAEGEKQLLNYTEATKLTATLLFLVKEYVKAKMYENGNKYNSRVERHSGLDNFFKGEIGVIDLHKKFKSSMQTNLYRVEKNKKVQRDYAIEKKEEMKKKKVGGN